MKERNILFVALVLLLVLLPATPAMAQDSNRSIDEPQASPFLTQRNDRTNGETQNEGFEKERLDLEREKLVLEERKLEIEQSNLRWTGLTILITVLVAAGTIWFNIWSHRQQAKSALELKAAELVMTSESPRVAKGRVKVLSKLFPRLGFPALEPGEFPGTKKTEFKLELFRAMSQYPDRKQEIIELWREIFPGEGPWFDQLFPVDPK